MIPYNELSIVYLERNQSIAHSGKTLDGDTILFPGQQFTAHTLAAYVIVKREPGRIVACELGSDLSPGDIHRQIVAFTYGQTYEEKPGLTLAGSVLKGTERTRYGYVLADVQESGYWTSVKRTLLVELQPTFRQKILAVEVFQHYTAFELYSNGFWQWPGVDQAELLDAGIHYTRNSLGERVYR